MAVTGVTPPAKATVVEVPEPLPTIWLTVSAPITVVPSSPPKYSVSKPRRAPSNCVTSCAAVPSLAMVTPPMVPPWALLEPTPVPLLPRDTLMVLPLWEALCVARLTMMPLLWSAAVYNLNEAATPVTAARPTCPCTMRRVKSAPSEGRMKASGTTVGGDVVMLSMASSRSMLPLPSATAEAWTSVVLRGRPWKRQSGMAWATATDRPLLASSCWRRLTLWPPPPPPPPRPVPPSRPPLSSMSPHL